MPVVALRHERGGERAGEGPAIGWLLGLVVRSGAVGRQHPFTEVAVEVVVKPVEHETFVWGLLRQDAEALATEPAEHLPATRAAQEIFARVVNQPHGAMDRADDVRVAILVIGLFALGRAANHAPLGVILEDLALRVVGAQQRVDPENAVQHPVILRERDFLERQLVDAGAAVIVRRHKIVVAGQFLEQVIAPAHVLAVDVHPNLRLGVGTADRPANRLEVRREAFRRRERFSMSPQRSVRLVGNFPMMKPVAALQRMAHATRPRFRRELGGSTLVLEFQHAMILGHANPTAEVRDLVDGGLDAERLVSHRIDARHRQAHLADRRFQLRRQRVFSLLAVGLAGPAANPVERHAAHVAGGAPHTLAGVHDEIQRRARPQAMGQRVVRQGGLVEQPCGCRIGLLDDANVVNPQGAFRVRIGCRLVRQQQEPALVGEQVKSLAHRKSEFLPVAAGVQGERARRSGIDKRIDALISGPAKQRFASSVRPRPERHGVDHAGFGPDGAVGREHDVAVGLGGMMDAEARPAAVGIGGVPCVIGGHLVLSGAPHGPARRRALR